MKPSLLIIVMSFCLITACHQRPIIESEARKEATRWFFNDCKAFNWNPASFNGPELVSVGGILFAYKWTHKSGKWGTLITVRSDWEMNISGFGDIPPKGQDN